MTSCTRENLDQVALRNQVDKSSISHGYTKYYEPIFEPMRDLPIRLVEIGVQFGASIKTWLDYFTAASIIGVDCCDAFKCDHPRYRFFLGDQTQETTWSKFIERFGTEYDIIIDDGCHMPHGVITSFKSLWLYLNSPGYYIIEDVFSAYTKWFDIPGWPNHMDFIKGLIDDVNQHGKAYPGHPTPPANPEFTELERDIEWIHFSKGLVIIKKK